MDEDSPWGALTTTYSPPLSRAPVLPDRLPSPPPDPGVTNKPDRWADEDAGGGWGSSVDDYVPSFASTSKIVEPEVGLDDVDSLPPANDTATGWQSSPELTFPASLVRDEEENPPQDGLAAHAVSTPPRSPSPRRRTPSPTPESNQRDTSGWGSPTLPSFPLPTAAATSPSITHGRQLSIDKGWKPHEDDDAWDSNRSRTPPLPTLRDLGLEDKRKSQDETEGWGGEREWKPREDVAEGDWEDANADYERRGKSIPASHVDQLKSASRELAASSFPYEPDAFDKNSTSSTPAPLSQPPSPPPDSTISHDTPLPSLFKLTPTTYPAFKDGLQQTAAKSSEVLGSATQKASRFSSWRRKPAEPPAIEIPPPLPVLDPETTKPRGWFGRSNSVDPAPPSPAAPTNAPVAPSAVDPEEPEPSAGLVGRLWNKWKKGDPSSPTQSNAGSPRGSEERQRGRYDEDEVPKSAIRQAKEDDRAIANSLGGFFGDSQPPPRPITAEGGTADGFSGLMDAFDTAPASNHRQAARPAGSSIFDLPTATKSTITTKARQPKSLDPFDPFADDDDGTLGDAIAPSPSSPSSRAGSVHHRAFSPPLATAKPLSPNHTGSSTHSLPTAIVAPQARLPPSKLAFAAPVDEPDPLDSFFSRPAASASQLPPLRTALSPPLSVRTGPSPGPRSGSASPLAFAPPPVVQPVSRAFGLAPPPSSSSPVGGTRVNLLDAPALTSQSSVLQPTAQATNPPVLPKAGTGGPLGKDDLSFFEDF